MLVSLREPVDSDNMLLLTGLVGWRVDIYDFCQCIIRLWTKEIDSIYFYLLQSTYDAY